MCVCLAHKKGFNVEDGFYAILVLIRKALVKLWFGDFRYKPNRLRALLVS